jgi:hypothetical protein
MTMAERFLARRWGDPRSCRGEFQLLGVGTIVAESFGRIYFQSAIATTHPPSVCPDIHAVCEEGNWGWICGLPASGTSVAGASGWGALHARDAEHRGEGRVAQDP